MKEWILNKFFKEELRQENIKAFQLANQDIWETMEDEVEKQAKELSVKMLQELLSPIDWSYVVKYNEKTNNIYIGNGVIEPARLANLKAEAQFIRESDLWKLMAETPKAEAHLSMFVKSESLDDLKKGKAMLFTISQQENIINTFRR